MPHHPSSSPRAYSASGSSKECRDNRGLRYLIFLINVHNIWRNSTSTPAASAQNNQFGGLCTSLSNQCAASIPLIFVHIGKAALSLLQIFKLPSSKHYFHDCAQNLLRKRNISRTLNGSKTSSLRCQH
jgi:hypothetical protein